MWGNIAIAFILAFVVTFVTTPYTMKIAKKKQAFARCLFFYYWNKSIIDFSTSAIAKACFKILCKFFSNFTILSVLLLLCFPRNIISPPLRGHVHHLVLYNKEIAKFVKTCGFT